MANPIADWENPSVGFFPSSSHLATHFEETWEFQSVGDRTRVTRSFELTPKSALTRPLLWVISLFSSSGPSLAICDKCRRPRDCGPETNFSAGPPSRRNTPPRS